MIDATRTMHACPSMMKPAHQICAYKNKWNKQGNGKKEKNTTSTLRTLHLDRVKEHTPQTHPATAFSLLLGTPAQGTAALVLAAKPSTAVHLSISKPPSP
jgi:hypothetical protein